MATATAAASHASDSACITAAASGKSWQSTQCDSAASGRKNASLSSGEDHHGSTPASTRRCVSDPSVKRKTSSGVIGEPSARAAPVSTARIT